MPRNPCAFRQSDAKRLMRAAMDAGVGVKRIELGPDGKLVIVVDETAPSGGGAPATAPAAWDDAK
jgi:hypothetical protein